ncbi:hypothetical protein [Streptomyces sp. NPDC059166]
MTAADHHGGHPPPPRPAFRPHHGGYRFLRIARFFALASFSLRCATP